MLLAFLHFGGLAQETQESYTAQELVDKGYKRYSIESGIVISKHTGSTEGYDTLYFDMWGWREATYSNKTVSMMGFKTTTNEVSYLDGTIQYNYNPETKTATKINNTVLKNMTQNTQSKNLTGAGEQMLKDMGGEKVGTETVLGKSCVVYEIKSMGTKTWVWNGVTLKLLLNFMGMNMTTEALSIEANVKVPESKVKFPEGVKISEISMPAGFNFGGMGK